MTSKKLQWERRVVDPEEDREVLYRARKRFYGNRNDNYVDWLYYDNPAGHLFCSLAMDRDVIAGQYVVIPVDFVMAGREVKGGLSLHTFTHRSYQRQGIFTALAKDVFSRIASQGIPFTIGLPNKISRPGFLKKLQFVEPIPVLQSVRAIVPLSSCGNMIRQVTSRIPLGVAEPLIRRMRGLHLDVTDAPERDWLDGLWGAYSRGKVVELKKDAQWVQWRYIQNPRFSYRFVTATSSGGQPVGYVVWNTQRQEKRRFSIHTLVDIVATDVSSSLVLLQTFLNEIALESDIVKAMMVPFSMQGRALMAMGFAPYSRISFIVRRNVPAFPMDRYLKKGVWPISGSYADFL